MKLRCITFIGMRLCKKAATWEGVYFSRDGDRRLYCTQHKNMKIAKGHPEQHYTRLKGR